MKTHTGIYVDLGYRFPTHIAVIRHDNLELIRTIDEQFEFNEMVELISNMLFEYEIHSDLLVASDHPAFVHAVREYMKKEGLE